MAINRKLIHWSRSIHIYLSVALLVILVFFSVTGITLNHAETMTGEPRSTVVELDTLPELPRDQAGRILPSAALEDFLREEFGVRLALATTRYEDGYLVIDYQGPGSTTLIEIDQDFDEAYAETIDYGLIAVLNDLHKARNTDVIWSWFIDISSVVFVVFSIAGFILLLPNRRRFRRVIKYTIAATAIMAVGYFLGRL